MGLEPISGTASRHRVTHRPTSLWAASHPNSAAVNIRLTDWEDHRSRPFWDTGGAANLNRLIDHRSRPLWDTGTCTSREAVTVPPDPGDGFLLSGPRASNGTGSHRHRIIVTTSTRTTTAAAQTLRASASRRPQRGPLQVQTLTELVSPCRADRHCVGCRTDDLGDNF